MPWTGENDIRKALKGLACAKGTSANRIKAACHAALKYTKDYKRVVHALENFLWKSEVEHRLAGLYVIDAVIRGSRAKNGAKDVFTKRFGQHLVQTVTAVKAIPSDQQANVSRVLSEWVKRGCFTESELANAGAQDFIRDAQKSSPRAGNNENSNDSDKLASLLSIIKKQKEQHQSLSYDQQPTSSPPSSSIDPSSGSKPSRWGPPLNTVNNNNPSASDALLATPVQGNRGVLPRPEDNKIRSNEPNSAIRSIQEMPRRPTEMCRMFLNNGSCKRGRNCYFAHDEREMAPPRGNSPHHSNNTPSSFSRDRSLPPRHNTELNHRERDTRSPSNKQYMDRRRGRRSRSRSRSRSPPARRGGRSRSRSPRRPRSRSGDRLDAMSGDRDRDRDRDRSHRESSSNSQLLQHQQLSTPRNNSKHTAEVIKKPAVPYTNPNNYLPSRDRPLTYPTSSSNSSSSTVFAQQTHSQPHQPAVQQQHIQQQQRHNTPPALPQRSSQIGNNSMAPSQQQSAQRELCMAFQAGGCSRGANCRFEHGQSNTANSMGRGPPNVRQLDARHKTKLCSNFISGACRFGARCSFAHGENELGRSGAHPPPPTSRSDYFSQQQPPAHFNDPMANTSQPMTYPVTHQPPPPPSYNTTVQQQPLPSVGADVPVQRNDSNNSSSIGDKRSRPVEEEEEAPQFNLQYDEEDEDEDDQDNQASKKLRTGS